MTIRPYSTTGARRIRRAARGAADAYGGLDPPPLGRDGVLIVGGRSLSNRPNGVTRPYQQCLRQCCIHCVFPPVVARLTRPMPHLHGSQVGSPISARTSARSAFVRVLSAFHENRSSSASIRVPSARDENPSSSASIRVDEKRSSSASIRVHAFDENPSSSVSIRVHRRVMKIHPHPRPSACDENPSSSASIRVHPRVILLRVNPRPSACDENPSSSASIRVHRRVMKIHPPPRPSASIRA